MESEVSREEYLSRIDAASRRIAVRAFRGREMALQEVRSKTRLFISEAQLNVLECLREGPMRLTDMAVALRLSPPSITRQVQSLEQKGLVERASDRRDGRAVILSLSERGARAVKGTEETVRDLLRRVMTEWSDEDLRHAAPVLERLCDSIDKFEASLGADRPENGNAASRGSVPDPSQ